MEKLAVGGVALEPTIKKGNHDILCSWWWSQSKAWSLWPDNNILLTDSPPPGLLLYWVPLGLGRRTISDQFFFCGRWDQNSWTVYAWWQTEIVRNCCKTTINSHSLLIGQSDPKNLWFHSPKTSNDTVYKIQPAKELKSCMTVNWQVSIKHPKGCSKPQNSPDFESRLGN